MFQDFALNQLRRRMSCLRVRDGVSKCGCEFNHQRHVVIVDPSRLFSIDGEYSILETIENGAIVLEQSAHSRTQHLGPNIRHMIGREGRQ